MSKTILIAEDDADIRAVLRLYLESEGFGVLEAPDGEKALALALERSPDAAILDVMMPGMDGFELVRRIRERADCPILFLTAKTEEGDAVMGLGLGADDYIRKPCGAAELRAKVTAHLRREGRERHSSLEFGRVRIDLTAKRAEVDGAPVRLTPTEYALCEHLARRRGQVFSKEALLEEASGWDSTASAETITAHVSSIRSKFKAHGVNPIGTVWGMGYRWEL